MPMCFTGKTGFQSKYSLVKPDLTANALTMTYCRS